MDELNDEQRNPSDVLQDEIAAYFERLKKAGRLEQRQLEDWLSRLQTVFHCTKNGR